VETCVDERNNDWQETPSHAQRRGAGELGGAVRAQRQRCEDILSRERADPIGSVGVATSAASEGGGEHCSRTQWVGAARQTIATLQDAFAEPLSAKALGPYYAGLATWAERREVHRQQYEQAKARAAAHEETLRQIRTLEERLAEINEAAESKKQQLSSLGDPVVRNNPITRRHAPANIRDAAHQELMRLERHVILRDDVANAAPGRPSW
jgi:hypothetical protein